MAKIIRHKVDNTLELVLLHAIMVDSTYCNLISPHRDHVLFTNKTLNKLYSKAHKHFKQYNEPIGSHILTEVHGDDKEAVQLLKSIDFEEKVSGKYCYDKHIAYINEQLAKDVEAQLSSSDDKHGILRQYSPLSPIDTEDLDFMAMETDERWRTVDVSDIESMINMGGGLGKLWNAQFVPHAMVAIQAIEKGGKSWVMMEALLAAARTGKNCLYISTGDMSTTEVAGRIHIRVAGANSNPKYTEEREVAIPDCKRCLSNDFGNVYCKHREDRIDLGDILEESFDLQGGSMLDEDGKLLDEYRDEVKELYKPCPYIKECWKYKPAYWLTKANATKVLDAEMIERSMKRFKKSCNGAHIRLKFFRMDDATVSDIENYIDSLFIKYEYIPDFIVIDYMDTISPNPKAKTEREGVNGVWKEVRKLSQREDREWMILTATQADADAANVERQTRKNFSGDKRKYGHVTAMYALNQTEQEHRHGVRRINPLALRSDGYDSGRDVIICDDLARGRINNHSI